MYAICRKEGEDASETCVACKRTHVVDSLYEISEGH